MEQQHKVHSWEISPFIPFFLQLLKLAIKCKSLRTFNVFVYGFPSQSLEHATTEGSFHSCFSSSVLWGFTKRKGLARLTVIEIGVICRRHVPSSPVAVCFVGVRVCCVVHGWRAENSRKEGRFHVNTELGTC